MKRTDEKLDDLATQVGHIETEISSDDKIEVNNLLKSVHEVKDNYQNLRKELVEVQDLQRQLSSSLQIQLKMMQAKFNILKEKIGPVTATMTVKPQEDWVWCFTEGKSLKNKNLKQSQAPLIFWEFHDLHNY